MYAVDLVKDPVVVKAVYEFIKGQNLDYPGYDEWAKQCYGELQHDQKKVFALTIKSVGKPIIVGSIIFQRCKNDNSVLELKNGRVMQEYRTKKVFKSIYAEVERYARNNGYKKIILDVHAGMDDVVHVMTKMGFNIEARENLYSPNQLELIMTKDLNAKTVGLVSIIADSKKLIKLMGSMILKVKYLLLS